MPDSGKLSINVGVNQPDSRALITDATLPDGDAGAIGVALTQGTHKFMIEKNEDKNAAWNDYLILYWDYNYNISNTSLPSYTSKVGDGSTSTNGYLPKADGTYKSTPKLSADIATWTAGTALGMFKGTTNTNIIKTLTSNKKT